MVDSTTSVVLSRRGGDNDGHDDYFTKENLIAEVRALFAKEHVTNEDLINVTVHNIHTCFRKFEYDFSERTSSGEDHSVDTHDKFLSTRRYMFLNTLFWIREVTIPQSKHAF